MKLTLPKRTLPIVRGIRVPNFLERLLFGIKCIGHCEGTTEHDMIACALGCWSQVREQKALPEKT